MWVAPEDKNLFASVRGDTSSQKCEGRLPLVSVDANGDAAADADNSKYWAMKNGGAFKF